MTDVAVSITKYESYTNKTFFVTFLLENIEDTQVNASSTLTRHPVPSGDYVADTMFKNPVTMDISGSVSLNGNQGMTVISDEGLEDYQLTLKSFETTFESLKNSGDLVDIVKVKTVDKNNPIFTIRKGMVLKNIRWIEKINSLDYTLSFEQVMQVEVQDPTVDQQDENLPDIADPKMMTFTESLFDEKQALSIFVKLLRDKNILTKNFFSYLSSISTKMLVGWGVGAGVAALLIGATGGAALLVGAVVAFGYCVYKLIEGIVKNNTRIKQFRRYQSDKQNRKEVVRYSKLMNDLLKSLKVLNQSIVVYNISSSGTHQSILTINDNYYCFTFTRNNDNNKYCLTILDLDGKIVEGSKTITDVKSGALKSLDDCNASNAILSTEGGYQVFLLNTAETRTDDLTECYLLISSIDMTNYTKVLKDLITKFIT